MSEDVTIIQDTQEARDEHGHLYGSEDLKLTRYEYEALDTGKALAIKINSEYVLFLTLTRGDS